MRGHGRGANGLMGGWEVTCKWTRGVGEVDGHGRELMGGVAVGLG